MSAQWNLNEFRTVDNSSKLSNISGVLPDNLPADAFLRILRADDKSPLNFILFRKDSYEEGVSEWTPNDVFSVIEDCRKAWEQHVVQYARAVQQPRGQKNQFPFQYVYNFRKEPELLKQVAPNLAQAGEKLFSLIFETECDHGLERLASALRAIMSEPRHLHVISKALFLPWGMLYTHPIAGELLKPDGSNWKKEGFWGYQHIIQHSPEKCELNTRICSIEGKVPLSINYDERISTKLDLPDINHHFDFIAKLSGHEVRRTKKIELEEGFTKGRSELERIVYFYCHGQGSTNDSEISLGETKLILTDGAVSAFDFKLWAKNKKLPTNPLLFINACQGGQMTTMFYKSLAAELLEQGAVGLVGAQVDIPAVFATVYARCIFRSFLSRKEPARLGPLLRRANQIFWDKYHNPLGLVYSLYRGVDCQIDWCRLENLDARAAAK
jgi:hypothetical protein